jgi:hypothetical protein
MGKIPDGSETREGPQTPSGGEWPMRRPEAFRVSSGGASNLAGIKQHERSRLDRRRQSAYAKRGRSQAAERESLVAPKDFRFEEIAGAGKGENLMEAKIEKISVQFGDRELSFTEEEARAVYAKLHELFGPRYLPYVGPVIVKEYIPSPPPYVPHWNPGWDPNFPQITCGAGPTIQ